MGVAAVCCPTRFFGFLIFWGTIWRSSNPKTEMRSRLLSGPISISRVCVFPCPFFFLFYPVCPSGFFFPCLKTKNFSACFCIINDITGKGHKKQNKKTSMAVEENRLCVYICVRVPSMALLAPIFYLYQTQWNKPLNSKNWTRKYQKKRREEPKKNTWHTSSSLSHV